MMHKYDKLVNERMSILDELEYLKEKYLDLEPLYHKLGMNIQQALELFLTEEEINFLTINYRIKELNSFLGKVQRKKYIKPMEQTEDFCGLRIVCYYPSDIKRIQGIINNEFDVISSQDKEELLQHDQFGYRSFHFVVKIKNEWLCTPNYKNLGDLKAEIQVRTILMHAWAEIEHKLEYKKEEDIPVQFKRTFSRISAKLEEADEQFEVLRNNITEHRNQLRILANEKMEVFSEDSSLNLDSLKIYLDYIFPDRKSNIEDLSDLLYELNLFKVDLKKLSEMYDKTKPFLTIIEQEENKISSEPFTWAQSGAVRAMLMITTDGYAEWNGAPPKYMEITDKWKRHIDNENGFKVDDDL